MRKKLPAIADRFSRPISGVGYLGGEAIVYFGDEAIVPDLEELIGQQVTGWRLGWESLDDAENGPGHTPDPETGLEAHELAGVLTTFEYTEPDGVIRDAWEIGGQSADPVTIRPAKPPRKKAKASSKPTAPASTRTAKPPKGKAKAGGQPAETKAVRPAKPPRKKKK